MGRQYLDLILKFPRSILAILLLLTVVAGYLVATLPEETSMESLIMEDDPDLVFYNTFKQQFGEDRFVVVGFAADDIFTPEVLQQIDLLVNELEQIDEVKEVISLTNIETIRGTDMDFIVEALCEQIPENDREAQTVRKRAMELESVRDSIVSGDGRASLFLIRTRPHAGDKKYDKRLYQEIENVFQNNLKRAPLFTENNRHMASWLVTDIMLSSYMNSDNRVFIPFVSAAIALFLFFSLRSLAGVVLGLVNVSICLLWTMAALNLCGGSLSPMTAIITPLIMALAISDSVHLLLHFFRQDRKTGDIMLIVRRTMGELWRPCFLTSLTTGVGFLSLLISDIVPIRYFGISAAAGMAFEFFLTMTLLPLLIYLLRDKAFLRADYKLAIKKGFIQKCVDRLPSIMEKRHSLFLVFSLLMIVFSLYKATDIRVDSNIVKYFKEDSRVARDFDFIDKNLNGANTIEISLQSKDGEDLFLEPDSLKKIEKIETFLKSFPSITTLTSINTFIKQMHQAFHSDDPNFHAIPATRQEIAQYLFLYGGDELFNFVDEEYSWSRISARTTEHSTDIIDQQLNQIRDFITREFADSGLDIRVTGRTVLTNKLADGIVNSQVYSLALAFVIIFVILFVVFRSIKLGCLAFIPNAIPIITNLGIMGLFDIPLNTATAIISAVAIGVAVDDTIHYLAVYQEERGQGRDISYSALEAIRRKGEPIVITSVILSCAFAILVLSNFVPTAQFGFLSGIIMLSAMVCDLVILPSLLLSFASWQKSRKLAREGN